MAAPSTAGRREKIMAAAESLLMQYGLHGWSVEQVARSAGCAKGLVHYHFGTRAALLAAITEVLGRERLERRIHALAPRGTAALDALWVVMREDVGRGISKAWLELGLGDSPDVRRATEPAAALLDAFAAASGAALESAPLTRERAMALILLLDGLEAGLARGAREVDLREAYDRVWLAMLG